MRIAFSASLLALGCVFAAALAACSAKLEPLEAEKRRKQAKDAKKYFEAGESHESLSADFGAKVRARRVRRAERVFV